MSAAAAAEAAVEDSSSQQEHHQPQQQQQPTASAETQPQAAQQQQQQQEDEGCSSSSPRDHEAEQQCHICMSSMQDATAVKGCGHQFCLACIQQWVSTCQQPCCPVCRAEVKTLVLADGSEQVAEPAAAAPPAEAEPDLSCLDHSYFLAEVSRLRSRAQSVHDRVYREAYGCGRRGDAHSTGLMLDGVQDVIDTLAGYRSTLEGEVRFDPQMLLHELYRLDRELTSLQGGSSGPAPAAGDDAGSAERDPWQAQQAADRLAHLHMADDHAQHEHEHDHDYDYDYDSADDDDWHEGLSRTPGRRPFQRHVVKHGRSNSGGGGSGSGSGGQQQQQQQQRQQLTKQQRGPIPRWRQGQGQGQGRQRGGGGNGPTGL